MIFSNARTFSGLSTKIVFNEARTVRHATPEKSPSKLRTLIYNMNDGGFPECVVERDVDHTMKMASECCRHPLETEEKYNCKSSFAPRTSTLLVA